MPKNGPSEAEWKAKALRYARGEIFTGRGWRPRSKKWKDTFDAIDKCPRTQLLRSGKHQSTLNFATNSTNSSVPLCTCGFSHDPPEPPAAPAAAAAPTTSDRPRKEIDFGILRKPEPRTRIDDVRNKYAVYKTKGCYDLEVFGYVDGKCPHCKGTPEAANLNKSVKIIYTANKPRFVQGIGLKCTTCSGKQWQSFEKTYVDTLPRRKQHELHAIIAGKSNGVDMDLIIRMRMGETAAAIERSSQAHLEIYHSALQDEYNQKCRVATQHGYDVVLRDFPGVDPSHVAKATITTNAFIRDFLTTSNGLVREMASLKTEKAMAMDHQYKVVRHAIGSDGGCSFTVVGDGGIVLGYYVVPDEGEEWLQEAMLELVERHGAVLNEDYKTPFVRGHLPPVIYVDKFCCGGTEGARSDAVAYFYGMLKKLDAFHLIQRIGKEANSEHPRLSDFLSLLSDCIFTLVEEDVFALEDARQRGGVGILSSKEQKRDLQKYVRKKITDPKTIVSKILGVVKGQVALDRAAKLQSIKAGDKCEDITTAHKAYPLITKKVLKCVMSQCYHILNGCVHDEIDMNVHTGVSDYRGTFISLDTYISLRGSSKVEALHSVVDRKVYAIVVMRQALFDARLLWHITHFNRTRLRAMGKETIPDGVAPSEYSGTIHLVESTNLRFGFDYYRHVDTKHHEEIEDRVIDRLESGIEHRLEEILDDDDGNTGGEGVGVAEEGINSNDDASYIEELREPLKTRDIPDSVDFNDLTRVGGTLESDVNWTTLSNPFAREEPIKEPVLKRALEAHISFDECVSNADALAADHGIDTERHEFASVDTDTFKASTEASGRRNAGVRSLRSQGVKPTAPDYNEDMESKFLEIWASGPNPSTGVKMKKWCTEAQTKYSLYRLSEISKAKKEGKQIPPLFDVNYQVVKEWAKKMKAQSNLPLCAGATNAESSKLSDQLAAFAATSSTAEQLGMGESVHCSDLSVTVAAAASTTLFSSPTSGEVERGLQKMMTTRKRSPDDAKKRSTKKSKKVPDEEFLRRKNVASQMMKAHSIDADPINKSRRRCPVCFKYKSFCFMGIPHVSRRSSKFDFCPLADDHSLYHDYVQNKLKDKRDDNTKRYQQSKR